MSGLDKNRVRNSTVSFRVSPEERIQLEARIIVSGMPKGEYFIQSLLHQNLCISVGKYQSDRLSLEFKKLREALEKADNIADMTETVKTCIALLDEVQKITKADEKLMADDFQAKKKS